MADLHWAAVQAAVATDKGIARLFAQLGTAEHPRGQALTAYRQARRALAGVLGQSGPGARREARDIVESLRRELARIAAEFLSQADELGQTQARRILEAYDLAPLQLSVDQRAAASVWLAEVEGQLSRAELLISSGGDPALIIGDGGRVGLLQPGEFTRFGSNLLLGAALAPLLLFASRTAQRDGIDWHKQPVAAIDERVTDTCLRVHGQTVPYAAKFKLTGEPRFADELPWTPFHWY